METKIKVERVFREYDELIVYTKSVFLLERPIDLSVLFAVALLVTYKIYHSDIPFFSLLFLLIAIYFLLQLLFLNYKNISKYIPTNKVKYDNTDVISFIVEIRLMIDECFIEIKKSRDSNHNRFYLKLAMFFLILSIVTFMLSLSIIFYILAIVSLFLLPFVLFGKKPENTKGAKNMIATGIIAVGKPSLKIVKVILRHTYNYLFSISSLNSAEEPSTNANTTENEEPLETVNEPTKEEVLAEEKPIKSSKPFMVSPFHEDLVCLVEIPNSDREQEYRISSKGFEFSDLNDGEFNINFIFKKGLSKPISLKKTKILKENGEYKPGFIDLSASIISLSFNAYDKPVQNSKLTGTIQIEGEDEILNLDSMTDSKGFYKIVLPKSKVEVMVKGMVDGKPVCINESYIIEESKPASNIEQAKTIRPKSFNKSVNCTNYTITTTGKKTVYLCDISGSMSLSVNGVPQIEKLKSTLKKKIEENKNSISIAAWNKKTSFSIGNEWLNSETKSKNKIRLINWVDSLNPFGGNDMKQAILSSISQFGDAEEFVVLCDGDISPFDLASWSTFYRDNSKYIFSFVGIGSSSDEAMKQMSQISNGQYSRVD
ncbi:hypothetical protein DICPUDRAFT_155482 [Dictyostelium purpureum]|uniref:VWFA domain-containing protein n=1 Tax=Dictyostelium purpureum TaxID=5786 RepID=F0ZU46_DICPU|nr:uncharacterized protein DICPUDRAFT_155482 [Dictyostelium purpureum]EGC32534.1 hypothetical protein DICPUDRAFT_155482 [Dictyostelium purpureum]|eukprot:XP_003290946.1 hypothetical protein DICPUDRAFT_155482 [Dictyostelium purpureum]